MKVITLAGKKFLIVEKSRAVAVKHIVGAGSRAAGLQYGAMTGIKLMPMLILMRGH